VKCEVRRKKQLTFVKHCSRALSTLDVLIGTDCCWDTEKTSGYKEGSKHISSVNLLEPTGHVMHQQVYTFNNLLPFPHCIYVFCIYLRTNSNFCPIQHNLIGFYNRDEKCLQRGTDWVFKWSGLRFVF